MVVVRLAVVACAISLGLTLGPAHAQEAVKVGVIGPFTGPSASSGIAMRKSFELAQEEFNSQGGALIDGRRKTIQFLFQDTQSKPEVGVSAAQKLLTRDNVEVMLAELLNSSVALAVMELAPSHPTSCSCRVSLFRWRSRSELSETPQSTETSGSSTSTATRSPIRSDKSSRCSSVMAT